MKPIDGALSLWLTLTVAALLLVAYDVARHTPISTVMKWGWLLVILYTGPVGLVVYLVSCREPLPKTMGRSSHRCGNRQLAPPSTALLGMPPASSSPPCSREVCTSRCSWT